MILKKIAGIICLILITFSFAFAQGNKDKKVIREKIKARKIGFITERLSLTSEEAQYFWPLYNEYHEEVMAIKKANKRPNTSIAEMTDAEIEELINARLETEANLLSMKRDYIDRLKTIIPIKKVAQLHTVERKFKEWMLQQSKGSK